MTQSDNLKYKITKIENAEGQQLGNDNFKVYEVNPNIKKKAKITKADILKHAKLVQDELINLDVKGKLIISTKSDVWISGNQTDIQTEQPKVYSVYDYDGETIHEEIYSDFRIYILEETDNEKIDKEVEKSNIQKRRLETVKMTKRQLKPIFYRQHTDNNKKYDYVKDGKLYENESFGTLIKYQKYPEKSGYRLFPVYDKNVDLIKEYDDYIEMADNVKSLTNGDVNMYKLGSLNDSILYEFNKRTPDLEISDFPVSQMTWIQNAKRGPLQYSSATEKNPIEAECKTYDVNSFYPYLLSSEDFRFPIEPGKFKTVDKVKFKRLAIYRCKVLGKVNPFLFKKNPTDYYINSELKTALEYGYEIELIQDGKPNALIFDNVVDGHYIFGEYINYFYEIKKLGDKSKLHSIKRFLSELLGALVEGAKEHHYTYQPDSNFTIHNDKIIRKINPTTKGTHMTFLQQDKQYKTPYWIIQSFLYAYARNTLPKYYDSQVDSVVRVFVDSFTLTADYEHEELLSNQIGFLKIEKDKSGLLRLKNTRIYKYDPKDKSWKNPKDICE